MSDSIPEQGTTPTMSTGARLASRSLLSQNRPGMSQRSLKTEIDQPQSQDQHPEGGQFTALNELRQLSSQLSLGDICKPTLSG